MNNFESDYFKVGTPFNACVIDGAHPLLANCSNKNLASTLVYASESSMHAATYAYGKKLVDNGVHFDKDGIRTTFSTVMRDLGSR